MAGLFYIHNGSIRSLAFKARGGFAVIEPGKTDILSLTVVPPEGVVRDLRDSGVVFRHAEPGEEPIAPPPFDVDEVDDTGAGASDTAPTDGDTSGSADAESGDGTKPPAPTGEARAKAIAEAVELLQSDGAAWTTAGTPRVARVEELVGFDVESSELADCTREVAG